MKSTSMVRKMDVLGRVVLPAEHRNTLDIKENDFLEIFIDGNKLVLHKYAPGCVFCGGTKNVSTVNEKLICLICQDRIKKST